MSTHDDEYTAHIHRERRRKMMTIGVAVLFMLVLTGVGVVILPSDLLNPSLNSLPVKLNKRVDLLSLLGKDVRKTHSINKIMK